MYIWRTGRGRLGGEIARLRRDMDDLVGALAGGGRTWLRSPWRETRLFPLLNVRETSDAFIVSSEIPGMKKEDLEVKIEGDTLSLRGERPPETIGDEASFHRRERAVGTFQRSLTLPGNVDRDRVNATYRHGVLTVRLFKETKSAPKEIKISAE
ncbi:MAG: Hsp20/alpha crystallin family protein [Desulfomonilaceae bacterium]|nr:Hsp20/alpha crystallin family protein [Desulfomonilaceae bacterium]